MTVIVARSRKEITLQVTINLTGSLMEMENNILDGSNEMGCLAIAEALQQFDTDGSPIKTITYKYKIVETASVANIIDLKEADQTRVLCILLTIQAVVSYRSVPRILELFKSRTPLVVNWIPHFTSVINWSLRLGLGLLKQVKPITEPWLAIMDHSIDIGTKKALVVLRVTTAALSKRGGAIRLEDCECIGLNVSEIVNGETISLELDTIFRQAGRPVTIIKDADASLQKGVRLWSEQQAQPVPTIDDIGHTMASALKAQFEKAPAYQRFITLVSHGAKCLRQTDMAFIMPPNTEPKGVSKASANSVNGVKKCWVSLPSKAVPQRIVY
jgi:hypothetical protein